MALPDDIERVATWSEFNPALMTLERGVDGTVYLVTWWYGEANVLASIRSDGLIIAEED